MGRATWLLGVALAALLAGLLPGAARAQVEIRATPAEPPRRLELVVPGPTTRELTRPREQEWYGEDQRVPYNPAFIEPFTVATPGGGKAGLSAYTAPHTPLGPQSIVNPLAGLGAFSLGLTIIFDMPQPDVPAR
jgi:hypothetical protein